MSYAERQEYLERQQVELNRLADAGRNVQGIEFVQFGPKHWGAMLDGKSIIKAAACKWAAEVDVARELGL